MSLASIFETQPTRAEVAYTIPEITGEYGSAQLGQIMPSTSGQKNYFPNWLGGEISKGKNFKTIGQFYSNAIGASPEEKIALGRVNPTLLTYDADEDKFNGPLGKDITSFASRLKNREKKLSNAREYASQSISAEQINSNVPKIVTQIIADNEIFSKFGIGRVTSKQFPLYAGRWIDPITGALKVLPKASSKYLNPASYDQNKQYLEARILNKWNEFVSVVEEFTKFNSFDKQNWESKQIKRIAGKFEKEKEVIGFPSRIINEYKKYVLQFPLGNGGKLFWTGIVKSGEYKTFEDLVKTCVSVYQNKESGKEEKRIASQNVSTAMNGLLKYFIDNYSKSLTPAQYSSSLSYGYNMSSNKLKEIQSSLMKISKIMNIPENLSELDVETLEKKMEVDKELIKNALLGGKGVSNESIKSIKLGAGSIKDILDAAQKSTRSYLKSNLPAINGRVQQPEWAGINFGKLQSKPFTLQYGGNNIIPGIGEPPSQAPKGTGLSAAEVQQYADDFPYGNAKKENYRPQLIKYLNSISKNTVDSIMDSAKLQTTIANKMKLFENEATKGSLKEVKA